MSKLGLRDKSGDLIAKMLRFDANWTTIDAAVMHFRLEVDGPPAFRWFMRQTDADAYVNDLNQRRAGNYSTQSTQPGTALLCDVHGTLTGASITYNFVAVSGVTNLLHLTTDVGGDHVSVFMTNNQADRYLNTLDQDLGLPNQ